MVADKEFIDRFCTSLDFYTNKQNITIEQAIKEAYVSAFECTLQNHYFIDFIKNNEAFSVKCDINEHPFKVNIVKISYCCMIDCTWGIDDIYENIQNTGETVLAIMNAKIYIAQAHHPRVRVNVLIRSYDLTEFVMYEEYLEHFRISDYEWSENERGNFEGFHKRTGEKCFTWQPHGSQFTIHSVVPDDAIKFRVRRPPLLTQETALENIGFDESWIEIL